MTGTPFEIHHFYWGIILLVIGFILIFYAPVFGIILSILGLILVIDDEYQHYRQRRQPEYRSPIHRLYGSTLYKLKFIQRLNAWADDLFRKR